MTDKCLRRYTYLPYLIDVLQSKRLTFLDPGTWDDRNDAYFMSLHKKRAGLQSLLALCFTDCQEKYAVWKVFAGSISGVSIQFDTPKLLHYLSQDPRVRWEEVTNPTKDRIKRRAAEYTDRLPFIKRWGFREIWEFRAIYENARESVPFHHVHVDIDSIDHITLSPWTPPAIYESNCAAIHRIEGCEKLVIKPSDLIDSERWKQLGDQIANLP